MKNYRKRIADDILRRKLEGKGAVLIEGPKWCGKTTTAEQLAASILYMDDPEKKEQNIAMSELNPKRLLRGATPRLIDEWQLAPKLWDAIRFEVDHRGDLGQFVLTGSAVPADTKEITHSGTGRFTWLTMRPMSLYESGDSTGEVSIKDLFEGNTDIDGDSGLSIDRLAFLVCRGGWPQAVDMRDEIALDQAVDYYDAVVHSDINRADNVQKNPERVRRLMRSYARNQGGQVPNTVLAQDIAANDETPISEETVASYVGALRKIFVVEDMEQAGVMNMAAYLRKMAIDGYVVRLELPELRDLISLLRRTSSNFNQIARRVNSTGRVYEDDIYDMKVKIEQTWDATNKVLEKLAAIN